MTGWKALRQADEPARAGEAFALATVVWRQGPSSGQLGSRAVITAAGELHGWIGGACAQPSVIRAAREALADGQPRLLLLGAAVQFKDAIPDGMTVVPRRLKVRSKKLTSVEEATAISGPARVGRL